VVLSGGVKMRFGFKVLLFVFVVGVLVFVGWLVSHLLSVLGALGL
jgi:hypothetical protein